MSVKSELSKNSETRQYPKLMKSILTQSENPYLYGCIMLFEREGSGTFVHVPSIYSNAAKVGEHRTDMSMGHFIDYEGSITLSNKE